jgi:SAM-dependent methyltransferase
MSVRWRLRSLIRRCGYELIPVQASLPREVKGDYEAVLAEIGEYSFKFLDVKTFLPMTIRRAWRLGLHKPPPLDVLDLGTGVGYFPVVCRHYGHRAVAIDLDINPVFRDATKWLGVDRRVWEIRRFEPLPSLGKRFDLVTAFMVNFDRVREQGNEPWGPDEWGFFLSDVARNQLKQSGRLALLLNSHTERLPGVIEYFKGKAASIDLPWVVFTSMELAGEPPSLQLDDWTEKTGKSTSA